MITRRGFVGGLLALAVGLVSKASATPVWPLNKTPGLARQIVDAHIERLADMVQETIASLPDETIGPVAHRWPDEIYVREEPDGTPCVGYVWYRNDRESRVGGWYIFPKHTLDTSLPTKCPVTATAVARLLSHRMGDIGVMYDNCKTMPSNFKGE